MAGAWKSSGNLVMKAGETVEERRRNVVATT
jgi:hypothetical protein